jgi:hypothetical protein
VIRVTDNPVKKVRYGDQVFYKLNNIDIRYIGHADVPTLTVVAEKTNKIAKMGTRFKIGSS